MRWREDGGDLLTGCQAYDKAGKAKGPGGMVSWHIPYGRNFEAHAWTRAERMPERKPFKSQAAAKRCVERWLATRAGRAK